VSPAAAGSTDDGGRYIATLMTSLEQLLVVQEHDSALEQLRHRRANLAERQVLTRAEAVIHSLAGPLTEATDRRDVVTRDVRRLEDEAVASATKVKEVEAAMYSGSVTSPRELQAMQADVEQLQRHQRALEDRELELMERQEAIDEELATLRSRIEQAERDIAGAQVALETNEAAIDREVAAESAARAEAAADIPPDLLALYGRCREQARGIGVARLVGSTCQGCRLTIPATEVARIRKAGVTATPEHCDNCGAILVPSR
jgi:uncharacterized protein